jgi:hypothetical protein
MKKLIYITIIVAAITSFACSKQEGEGGRASIKGKVWAVNYNSSVTVPHDSGYAGGEKVYIIYGDDTSVGDRQETTNDGSFEFKYLRKGKYKLYIFSAQGTNLLDKAVVQDAEITKRIQTIELPDFKIKTTHN